MSKSKHKHYTYKVGNVYTVEIRGAWLEPEYGERIKLHVGDMLQYTGSRNPGRHYQSDPVPLDHFKVWGSHDGEIDHPAYGKEGAFWPNNWGNAQGLAHLYDADEL